MSGCLHQLFEAQVEQTPDAVAVQHRDWTLSYRVLNERANQIARHLIALGVGPDRLVGLFVERSLDMVVGLLAILKAGGAYVPLDPAYPEDRLAFLLQDAAPSVLLTQERLASRLSQSVAQVVCLDRTFDDLPDVPVIGNPASHVTQDHLAYLLYTSGSTGKPKGVLVNHLGLCNLITVRQETYGIQPGCRVLQLASISFDAAGSDLFLALCSGATLCIPLAEQAQDPVELQHFMKTARISFASMTPTILGALNEKELPDLTTVVVGGEVCPAPIAQAWIKRGALYNEYGPTEATVCTTLLRCTSDRLPPNIGYPIRNVQVYLLDAQMHPVPIGENGEIYIGGVGIARGYLHHPELNAERFIPSPFAKDGDSRLYRSGDIGRQLPDGSMMFLGRQDNQIKLRGLRIELGEIEAALLTHPAVKSCVVQVHEVRPGDKRLAAYVVPRSRAQDTEATVPQLDASHIQHWHRLSDEIYAAPGPATSPTFNITGWNSSYTGQPIPANEMRNWVEHTVANIHACKPRTVLELGCGSGLLLFRLAPLCARYVGTDISQRVIGELRKQIGLHLSAPGQVELHHCSAEDLSPLPAEMFDTVILNSVCQHFPSIEYLLRVLEGAVSRTQKGGHIFVGDVRSLPLLPGFHSGVQLHQATAEMSRGELARKVNQKLLQEEELVVDPAFFLALQQHIPQITDVKISLKRGHDGNELTRFRYDVVLSIENPVPAGTDVPCFGWKEETLSLSKLPTFLASANQEAIGIEGIPNAHVLTDIACWQWLRSGEAPSTVGEWRLTESVHAAPGIDPEAVRTICQAFFPHVELWPSPVNPAAFDLLLYREDRRIPGRGRNPSASPISKPWNEYGNDPHRAKQLQSLIPALPRYLRSKLPAYMVPSSYLLLDSFPLSQHGKVDIRALPIPDHSLRDRHSEYAAPQRPLEQTLVGIFEEVLAISDIGVNDNLVHLGGNSLLLVQARQRIQSELEMSVSLSTLLLHPTVSALARVLQSTTKNEVDAKTSLLVPASRSAPLPLSFSQELMWHLSKHFSDLIALNNTTELRIRGELHITAVQQALQALVDRHEILRTRFQAVDGHPVQIPGPAPAITVPYSDLSDTQDPEGEAARLGTEDLLRPFDIEEGPFLRPRIVRVGPQEYILLLCMHHMVYDGVSLCRVLIPEFLALYEGFVRGHSVALPKPGLQYADFAAWQRETLTDDVLAPQLAYWKTPLTDAPKVHFPMARPRPENPSYRGARHPLRCSEALTDNLRALASQEGVTLYVTLMAAFLTLLGRATGQRDVAVETALSHQERPELRGIIGVFVSQVLIRIDLSKSASFRDILQHVRSQVLGAVSNPDVPLVKLQQLYSTDPKADAFFNVSFLLDPPSPPLPAGWSLDRMSLYNDFATCDLLLQFCERGRELYGCFEYSTDLFDAAAISGLSTDFVSLLTQITEDPALPV